MPLDLSKTLVIGISATALFDLSEADNVFREFLQKDNNTLEEYRKYMLEREDDLLEDGTGMPLVEALLDLNKYQKEKESTLIEVVVMSRNSPETGIRVFNNIREKELKISRHVFTGGESVVDYLDAFEVDLFLTTNVKDAQKVTDADICAVAIVKKPPDGVTRTPVPKGQVRIAFDGDAVLFDDTSEIVYKTEGMEKFHQNEDDKQNIPMGEGPYASF